MTEIENSDPSATPSHAPNIAPDYAPGGGMLPPLAKNALNTLCDTGLISTIAWQRAVEFCGFRPDGKASLMTTKRSPVFYLKEALLQGTDRSVGAPQFMAGSDILLAGLGDAGG